MKVTAGKDKGREGRIERINFSDMTAVIAGVNIYKKHIKRTVAADGKGGVYEIPRPLAFGKIAVICPSCKKITRIGFREEKGKKIRFCRKCKKAFTGESLVLKSKKGTKK